MHMRNYFEIGPLAAEEMSFKSFSIFNSDGHFVEQCGTILAILVKGLTKCNIAALLRQYCRNINLLSEWTDSWSCNIAVIVAVTSQPSSSILLPQPPYFWQYFIARIWPFCQNGHILAIKYCRATTYCQKLEHAQWALLVSLPLIILGRTDANKRQEDHDGPISLTWPNRFAYLLLKFQPSSLL